MYITIIHEIVNKFKNNINIIIANIRLLKDILVRGTFFRLCEKLYIEKPPILALYRKGDEKIKEKFEKNKLPCKLVKFDKEDNSFPERYINAIRELYPDVIAELEKANEVWLRGDELEQPFDPREWLVKEGFLSTIQKSEIGKLAKDMEKILPLIKKKLLEEKPLEKKKQRQEKTIDYKKKFFELKKKYDELRKYVEELIDLSE